MAKGNAAQITHVGTCYIACTRCILWMLRAANLPLHHTLTLSKYTTSVCQGIQCMANTGRACEPQDVALLHQSSHAAWTHLSSFSRECTAALLPFQDQRCPTPRAAQFCYLLQDTAKTHT